MFWLLVLLAYLLGSLSFAILISQLFGNADPRLGGSGNPGASNMLRMAGRKAALFTLLGDLGKGLLPVLIAAELGLSLQQQAWVGLAAVLGHLYPLYFNFRGGKGVATAAGMLFGHFLQQGTGGGGSGALGQGLLCRGESIRVRNHAGGDCGGCVQGESGC